MTMELNIKVNKILLKRLNDIEESIIDNFINLKNLQKTYDNDAFKIFIGKKKIREFKKELNNLIDIYGKKVLERMKEMKGEAEKIKTKYDGEKLIKKLWEKGEDSLTTKQKMAINLSLGYFNMEKLRYRELVEYNIDWL